jgi:hypothetical protein
MVDLFPDAVSGVKGIASKVVRIESASQQSCEAWHKYIIPR